MAEHERIGIAGAGAIACGLAATAARTGDVVLWARSDRSAERARQNVHKISSRLEDEHSRPDRVHIVRDLEALCDATFIVEAVVEDHESKATLLSELSGYADENAVLSTTTSSLSIAELAKAAGRPDRFVGLHVFNPVVRMKLVELVFPPDVARETRTRARDVCESLGKVAVEVPDIPGFVVNRLLFPYLFSAVELMVENSMDPVDVDECMTLGAGVPMGPIALLDFVGLDVAKAIGEAIGAPVPAKLVELVEAGKLGRKTGEGFYGYD
jgi:3-hydroxybutyryl-CoA dehydrogenase